MPVNSIQSADRGAVTAFVWVFLIAWLSQLVYLLPLPDLAKLSSPDVVAATRATGWIVDAVSIAFGLIAGIVALKRRIGITLMLISSLGYVITWWVFSGYFDVHMSMMKMFTDLWSVAKSSGRQLIFLHRDVLLNAFYHLSVVFLAYRILLGRLRTAPA